MGIFIISVSILSILGTFLPYISSDHWIVRGQTNFKLQYLILNCIAFISVLIFLPFSYFSVILLFVLSGAIYDSIRTIYPYTKYAKPELSEPKIFLRHKQISLLVFNVYQNNNKFESLLDAIKKYEPHIILLLETDQVWESQMKAISGLYPHGVKKIRNDTYGILFMSKIKLEDAEINYWVSEKVPSIEALLKIDNHMVRILGLHPKPPIPGEKLYSTQKDKEILKSAHYLESMDSQESHILIGDLNEVAWSRTSRRFKRITGMKDPRIGRGYYATFPAYSPIKFPLDHILCDSDFKLVDMKILDNMGSDHHPLFIRLQLDKLPGKI